MLWVTLAHVHLDRVASPWLVKRFVDPEATFRFIEWGLDGELPDATLAKLVPADAIALAIPGVKLGLHDADGSCFLKILRNYELEDPALWRLERVVSAGISEALGTPGPPEVTEEERVLGGALNQFGHAFGILFDDPRHLEAAAPLYDAAYELCRLKELPPEVAAAAPRHPPLRNPYLREALAEQLPRRT